MKELRLGEELRAEIEALRGLDSEAFEQVAAIAAAQLRSGAPGRPATRAIASVRARCRWVRAGTPAASPTDPAAADRPAPPVPRGTPPHRRSLRRPGTRHH